MSTHTTEAIQRQKRIYKIVGAALIAGTIITVVVAQANFGLFGRFGVILGIVIALVVAAVKGSLVAGYFMHLFHEHKMIYWVLALTGVFIVAMLGLILFAYGDQQGQHHGIFRIQQQHVRPFNPGAAHTGGEHVP
jgi:caa(3)-type oxidase subunit IV